jgi:hypothetical protein
VAEARDRELNADQREEGGDREGDQVHAAATTEVR